MNVGNGAGNRYNTSMPEKENPPRDGESAEFSTETDPTVIFVPIKETALTPETARAIAGVKGTALIVERGPEAGKTWLLGTGDTELGRHPSNDIVLDDITVSRRHCTIRVAERKISLLDAGSTNGSYVNGQRVDAAPLAAGDRLLIGKFHLMVARGDG